MWRYPKLTTDIRVAVVGAGRMGAERAKAAARLGARVLTVCDIVHQRAAELANQVGATAVSTLTDIPWDRIDAVFVCTPPGTRGPAELMAIQASVPFFTEKPIATTSEGTLSIWRALQIRPVVNAVGYMNRYRPSVLQARNIVSQRQPLGIAFHWVGGRYRVPWWLSAQESGGPVNEQCTHFIDLCRFLVGEIAEVSAMATPVPDARDVSGSVAMALRFQNDILATGLYTCEATEKQIAFHIFLPDQTVRLDGWNLRLSDCDNGLTEDKNDIFVAEVGAFFQAIRSEDRSLILSDFESAMKTQLAIDAILRAANCGHPQRLGTLSEEIDEIESRTLQPSGTIR